MAEAPAPPPGPPSRDPTAPARLLDAAAEIGLRVERVHRDVDGLERAVERLADAARASASRPVAPDVPPLGAGPDRLPEPYEPPAPVAAEARALAIDLAVGGASRQSIEEQIQQRFGSVDVRGVLDALFAPDPPDPPGSS